MTTQHENCTELIDELIDQTLCTEPRDIADALGITIKTEDLPYDVFGIYTEIGTRCFIVLNEMDAEDMQRYVSALCLYYHLTKTPRVLLRAGPVDGNYDAGRFAYALLSHGKEGLAEGFKHDEASGIPQAIIEQAKRRLN